MAPTTAILSSASILLSILICLSGAKAKDTTLQFYMHDNVFPPNQTALMVAGVGASSSNPGFGTVTVIDDALTEGPEQNSKPIGRGQGTWIVSALDGSSLLLTFSSVFHTGEYNGSTLSFHGADIVSKTLREIAVVGGTGAFRYARGYATIKTHKFTPASVTLKVDVTVTH